MNPVNVQLKGKLTAIKDDPRSLYMRVLYQTPDADGELRIPKIDAVNMRKVSQRPLRGQKVLAEYVGTQLVGAQIGATVILARPGFSKHRPSLG
ncbi:MAG: hypothetical protein M3N08_07025 [Pseudomonadota bacterium]|nr:hypothetical protein [Pseudomonadota bacterium]